MKQERKNDPEAKAERIVRRIYESIPQSIIADYCTKDCKWNNLQVDLKKAQKNGRYTSVAIINNQLHARTNEIIEILAKKKIEETLVNGTIVTFLDEDDSEKYNYIRAKYIMLLDAADSTLNDLEALIRACGLAGELVMMPELKKSREMLVKLSTEGTGQYGGEYSDIWEEESDKLYNYMERRMPYHLKNIAKRYAELNPKEKEEEK